MLHLQKLSTGADCDTPQIHYNLFKKILRKPSRFTFDVVPSISESYSEDNGKKKNKNVDNIVIAKIDSGLSILDDPIEDEDVANNVTKNNHTNNSKSVYYCSRKCT